jgi:hypothetical protein
MCRPFLFVLRCNPLHSSSENSSESSGLKTPESRSSSRSDHSGPFSIKGFLASLSHKNVSHHFLANISAVRCSVLLSRIVRSCGVLLSRIVRSGARGCEHLMNSFMYSVMSVRAYAQIGDPAYCVVSAGATPAQRKFPVDSSFRFLFEDMKNGTEDAHKRGPSGRVQDRNYRRK